MSRKLTDDERRISKEKRKEYERLYRSKNSERLKLYRIDNKDRIREMQRGWENKNRDKLRESCKLAMRRWRLKEENMEKGRQYTRKYNAEHLEKHRVDESNRRARKRGNGGSYTVNEFLAACDLFGNRCLCCGCTMKLEADHVTPLSRGGRSDIVNIQPLCKICNARKNDNEIDYRMLPIVQKTGVIQIGVS